MKKLKIIPIFVPHRGCPHRCSFCNQRHITGTHDEATPQTVRDTAEKYLSTMDKERHSVYIAFYGGSFTAVDRDIQDSLLNVALEYKNRGLIDGIRLSTRPDCIDSKILQNLREKGVTEIELGVQSMCADVLMQNGRGHTAKDVEISARMIKEYGFTLGLQMMIGLIGDTEEKSIYTARRIAALKPDFVRIYPTLVFKNTDLYDEYIKGSFTPLTLEQAVEISAVIMRVFNENRIKVIRLGLLISGDEAEQNLVAGPYHPRFRELVEKRLNSINDKL
ncbi:MAG: Oxygen-independent coproporphyrinogen-III oxidase 1 [Firmicutes bacterium ADurb.Bin193]|nr:MAG: Oxygen-independent coproporphyrinogen-III oxidase 1 [Firmicutes bacterium ADurb.Bin193]